MSFIADDIGKAIDPPNYIDPPSRAPAVIGTNVAFIVLALIFLVLRIISRVKILKKFTYEDHLIVASWFFSAFTSFCMAYSTKTGTGRHMKDIPPEWFIQANEFPATWLMTWTYTLTNTCIKASILLFYLRLSPQRWYRYSVWAVMFFVVGTGVSGVLVLIFQCNPIAAAWDFSLVALPTTKCLNALLFYRIAAGFNFVSDVFIFFLPMPTLYKLQLPLKQRLSIMAIFALGGLVTVISAIRIFLVIQAETSGDYTWVGALSAIWSAAEVNVALIIACLPAIKPLVTKYFPRLLHSTGFAMTPKASYAPGYAPYALSNMNRTGHSQLDSGVYHGKRDDQFLTSAIGRKGASDSEEYIISHKAESGDGVGITKTVEFNVKVDDKASSELQRDVEKR